MASLLSGAGVLGGRARHQHTTKKKNKKRKASAACAGRSYEPMSRADHVRHYRWALEKIRIRLYRALTLHAMRSARSEGALSREECNKIGPSVESAARDMESADRAKYDKALQFLRLEFAYLEHQRHLAIEGAAPNTAAHETSPEGLHRLLDMRALAGTSFEERMHAALLHVPGGRVAVHDADVVECGSFVGTMWVRNVALHVQHDAWTLLQIVDDALVCVVWTDADGSPRTLRLTSGGWQSRHRRQGRVTRVTVKALDGCARFVHDLDAAAHTYAAPNLRVVSMGADAQGPRLIALERVPARGAKAGFVCPLCRAESESGEEMARHLGMSETCARNLQWVLHTAQPVREPHPIPSRDGGEGCKHPCTTWRPPHGGGEGSGNPHVPGGSPEIKDVRVHR